MAQRDRIPLYFGCCHQCGALEISEGQSPLILHSAALICTLHPMGRTCPKPQSGHAATPCGTVAYNTR